VSAALVLDDSILRRNFFVNWMEPGPFFADTPQQAIKIFDDFAPNLILLDYDLGMGVDSTSFACHLAQIRSNGKVIVTSENPFGWASLGHIIPSAIIKPFPMLRREIERSYEDAA
jgi:CheY-like chemotaxis protein